jgi:lipopolysaccharide export system protein LptA
MSTSSPIKRRSWCLAAVLALVHATAFGLSTDKDQPVFVDADNMELDFKTGVRTYLGNVTIRQGSLNIWGDKVVMQYKDGALQTATAYGAPAKFKQLPDNATEEVHGRAPRIVYVETKERLHMYDDATLVQGPDTIQAKQIDYDINTSTMVASGSSSLKVQPKSSKTAPAKPSAEPAGDGRSRIRIQPKAATPPPADATRKAKPTRADTPGGADKPDD